MFAEVWCFTVVGADDSAIGKNTRDARDVATAAWNDRSRKPGGFPIGMHCDLGGLVLSLFETRDERWSLLDE